MFKFNNTHIFTGYLKQLLSSTNIPACKIYTKDFADFKAKHGHEDPRVFESFDDMHVNYIKNNELYNYYRDSGWKRASNVFYNKDKMIPGMTRTLNSRGSLYDTETHEYLGEYLRFLRDYYNINLMPLYNCFNNKIYNNIYQKHAIKTIELDNPNFDPTQKESDINYKKITKYEYTVFDSQDSKYNIYAFPVKLFANYTIAIDCQHGIEMFCGLYKTALDILSSTATDTNLMTKTYKKENRTTFGQPFLYDCLDISNWQETMTKEAFLNGDTITCWDIINREQDLKLFIKVPASCKSSIVVLEGDYRKHNNAKYAPVSANIVLPKEQRVIKQNGNVLCAELLPRENGKWIYQHNHLVSNFSNLDLQSAPITKLQLLALNTGESYPFSTRLIEYLTGSAITPIDELPDNIKRVQKVMNLNKYYFKVEGLWEDKMQRIIYDHLLNAGPLEVIHIGMDASDKENFGKEVPPSYNKQTKKVFIDRRRGYQKKLGLTSKSTLYDILGYVDKDAEKWYTSWTQNNDNAKLVDNIHSIDIYDNLYEIQ
jgi:ubiquinone/menaquinone biosynthesis C-methylase UbiE